MKKDIHNIVGAGFSSEDAATFEACINGIEPAIRRLRAQGRPSNMIAAALISLSASTATEQSTH